MARNEAWPLSRRIRELFALVDGGNTPAPGSLKSTLTEWEREVRAFEEGHLLAEAEEQITALAAEKADLSGRNQSLEAENKEWENVLKDYSAKIASLTEEQKTNPKPKKPNEWEEGAVKILVELAKLDYPVELPKDRKTQLVEMSLDTGIPASDINRHLHAMHLEGLAFMVRDEAGIVIRWEINDGGREVLYQLKRAPEAPPLEIEVQEASELKEVDLRILKALAKREELPPESKGISHVLLAVSLSFPEIVVRHHLNRMQELGLVISQSYTDGRIEWHLTTDGIAFVVENGLFD